MTPCPVCSHDLSAYSRLPPFCPACNFDFQAEKAPEAYSYSLPSESAALTTEVASNMPYVIISVPLDQQHVQQQHNQQQHIHHLQVNASKQQDAHYTSLPESLPCVEVQPAFNSVVERKQTQQFCCDNYVHLAIYSLTVSVIVFIFGFYLL